MIRLSFGRAALAAAVFGALAQTTVAALKRDNRNVAVLHPGMILIVHR